MNNPRKITAYLNGGIGNQMFQYAAARSLALRHGAELVVDDWSGFVRDHQYRRNYELGALPIQARIARPWERLPIWLCRWEHRQRRAKTEFFESRWYGDFVTETQFTYIPQVHQFKPQRPTWLVGYWQSPMYFQDHAATLRAELMPPAPAQPRFLALGEELQRSESVALGVRLYEESTNPGIHAHGGQSKGVDEIRSAVERLRTQQPQVRYYVFCTYRSPLLVQLGLPDDTVFVTGDDGYDGTLGTLWLLTRCRHHIFTNSSYYWWGAWLSGAVRGGEGQRILAADNFINHDGLCVGWERF